MEGRNKRSKKTKRNFVSTTHIAGLQRQPPPECTRYTSHQRQPHAPGRTWSVTRLLPRMSLTAACSFLASSPSPRSRSRPKRASSGNASTRCSTLVNSSFICFFSSSARVISASRLRPSTCAPHASLIRRQGAQPAQILTSCICNSAMCSQHAPARTCRRPHPLPAPRQRCTDSHRRQQHSRMCAHTELTLKQR